MFAKHLTLATALALALATANAAGIAPGGVPGVAAAWAGTINVYANNNDGRGRVTSEDGSIDCVFTEDRAAGDCSATYTYADFVANASVSMRYTPEPGSYVCDSHVGGCVTSGAYVGFNVDFARGGSTDAYLAPQFLLKTYKVLVDVLGPGSASINGTPCTPPFSFIDFCASFKHGSTVTMMATADPGYPFNGWSLKECPTPASTTCSFTITGPPSDYAFAVFGQIRTDFVSGTGGKVCDTLSLACAVAGTPRFSWYEKGKSMSLAATPDPGWAFAGWSAGPCGGAASTCTFALVENATITASFHKLATPSPTSAPRPTTGPTIRPGTSAIPGSTAGPGATTGAEATLAPGATTGAIATPGSGAPDESPPTATTAPGASAVAVGGPVGSDGPRASVLPQPVDAPGAGSQPGVPGVLLAIGILGLLLALGLGFMVGRRGRRRRASNT